MIIYFVSSNDRKFSEVSNILKDDNIIVKHFKVEIDEIQSKDAHIIIKDKLLKAFKKIKRPLLVEHTGLYINDFGELPGGLTRVMWESLTPQKFCDYFGGKENNKAEAKTIVGFCDGKNIKIFEGSVLGSISKEPKGDSLNEWDCVFIPNGFEKTFSELGDKKNELSMRKIALEKFKSYLKENDHA